MGLIIKGLKGKVIINLLKDKVKEFWLFTS